MSFRLVVCLTLVALVTATASTVSTACDTPVYRYAMYRWQPTPYEVYYFHMESARDEDEQTHAALKKAIEASGARANVVLLPVDLKEDKELIGVPPDVKKAWLARKDQSTPTHMVVSPQGLELFTGDLKTDEIASLIDSPLRQKIGKHLEEGKAAVFLFLTSGDMQADKEVEKTLKQLVDDVKSEKINLYSGPQDLLGRMNKEEPKDAAEEEKSATQGPEIAYVKVSPNDDAERWLVRQLMAVEDDLEEFKDKPMVFAVYGRGRALPPFIGKGIDRDNLIGCIEFVTGACSCTVKEQNPGVDLLVRYDWESASAAVAEKFGSEEGNENRFAIDEFFPDLIIGGDMPDKSSDQPGPDDEPRGLSGAIMTLLADTAAKAIVDTIKGKNSFDRDWLFSGSLPSFEFGSPSTEVVANQQKSEPEVSSVESEASLANGTGDTVQPPSDSKQKTQSEASIATRTDFDQMAGRVSDTNQVSTTLMLTIGLGIGLALFVLIGATLVLFKPR